MATPTPRPEARSPDTALLSLMWLASPALPVGGFSYSEGFEAAVEAGFVGTEAEAANWLSDQLQLGLARCELVVVAQAFRAWQMDISSVDTLNVWMRTTRESAEMRLQTEQMGRSLVEWLRNGGATGVADDPRIAQLAALSPAPCWPVAFALAAALAGCSSHQALLAFGFGWVENMVQAAMKAVPLGQAAAQRILSRLAQALPAAVDAALRAGDPERQAFAPMLAILSARHEMQYSRLFRS